MGQMLVGVDGVVHGDSHKWGQAAGNPAIPTLKNRGVERQLGVLDMNEIGIPVLACSFVVIL